MNGGQASISSGKVISPSGNIVANTNSAHLTSLISGGEVAFAAPTSITVSRDATLSSDLMISSVISGVGNITKAGSGTLTLSGANTHTGTTTVSGGTLVATNNAALGAATANAVVNTGATLSLGGGVTVGKTTGTLTLSGEGTAAGVGALNAGGATDTKSYWKGGITLADNTTITAGDNQLIVGDGNLSYPNSDVIDTVGYTLTINTTSTDLVAATYEPGGYSLDDTNMLINAAITGTGGLTKTGAGTATLFSYLAPPLTSYTGATLITGGKLIVEGTEPNLFYNPVIMSSTVTVGNSSSPGSADTVILQMGQLSSASSNYLIGTYDSGTNVASTDLTIYEDGLFDMNRGSNRFNLLTLQGGHVTGGDATLNPLLTLVSGVTTLASAQTALIEESQVGMSANGFTFTVADGAAGTDLQVNSILQNGIGFTSPNTGTSLIKTGTGTMVLTALNANGGSDDGNTYDGVTDVQQGVLNIQHANALGQTGVSLGGLDNGTKVQSGAQLQIEGGITVDTETLSLSGTGISSDGALLNQAGDNTYNGYVYLDADSRINANTGTTLDIANTGGVNAGIMNGSSAGKNLTVGGSGNIIINGAIGSNINNITKDGSGTLTLAGNNAYAGATNVTAGAVKITHNNGLYGTGATVSNGAALQFAQNASSANISVVGVGATISGTGLSNGGAIQNLNGDNSYAGNVTLAANSRITANSGSTLTNTGSVTGAGFALDAGGVGNTTYNGVISGSGTALNKTDMGTVTLGGSGANTFTGGLNVKDGTLNLNKTAGINALAASGTVTVGDNIGAANSATLALLSSNQMPDSTALVLNSDGRISMGTASDAISTIAGTGQIDLGTTGKLTIGADNSTSSFSGSATGTGTLEKLGTGSLTLNTDLNYGGTFKLGGGTLVLNDMDLSVTNLEITANSTIDFSGVSSNIFAGTLNFLNTSITLNIINWNKNVDYFFASNWSGATQDILDNLGAVPMSQIVFAGWAANNTGWDSYDDQIYPNVPEPSTYGLILMALCSALLALRKYLAKRKD